MSKETLGKYFVSLSKDSAIYGLGFVVLKGLTLAITPVLTRIFSPADYGVINLVASVVSFLSLFMIFGMDSAVGLSFYEFNKEKKVIVSSGFWFLLFWSMLIVIIATAFSGPISLLFLKSSSFAPLLIVGFFGAIFTLLVEYLKTVLRLEFRAKTFAIIAIVTAVLSVGLIILLTTVGHLGLIGYFLGSFFGVFLGFLLALFLTREYLTFKISKLRLYQMVSFGAMLVPVSLATYIFDLSDRFFVNRYWNLGEVGFYSIAFNITALISFFALALSQAWSPFIMKIYFNSRAIYEKFLFRAFSYLLIFFSSLAVLVCIFSSELIRVFATEKFQNAGSAITPLAISAIFSASIQVTALGISISRKPKYLALFTAVTAIFNTGLNFLLIPKYGIAGAGWATALSYFFLTSLYLWKSQKLIPFPADWGKVTKLLFFTLLTIFLAPLAWRFGFWLNFSIKIAEFAGYFMLLCLTEVIEKKEILYLFNKVRKLRFNRKNFKKNGN